MYRKYYKYIPNFTIVGSPAIFENSVTGFSSSNYLKTIPESIPFETADNWEVVFKFKYLGGSYQNFLAQPVGYASTFIITSSGELGLYINITGDSTYVCQIYSSNHWFEDNNIYYAKAGFTGTEYYIEYSEDGQNWLDRVSYSTTTKLTNRGIWTVGAHMQSGYYDPILGTLYLDESYIKINGNYYWKGVTYQKYVEKTIPNTFTVGSPTNNNCILSNFSNSDYLQLFEGFAPGNNTWEMVWKVSTPGSISNLPIIGNYDNTYQNAVEIGIDSGKWRLVLPKDGTSTYLANISGTHSVQANTIYWIKAEFTGSQYILSYSLDGLIYTQDAIINSSEIVYQAPKSFYIGNNAWKASSGTYWTGSIDLNGCYIKINGQYWWKGTVTPSWDYYEDFYNYKAFKETVRKYYKYVTWTQPILSENGTMGGDAFACNQSSYHTEKDGTKREAWQAFDNNTGTRWQNNNVSLSTFYNIEWYCPIPIITSSLSMQTSTTYPVKDYVLYGSNNYIDWIELASGTNAGSSVDWTITIATDKQKEYSYFRLSCKPTSTKSMMVNSIGINAVYITDGTSSDYDFYKDIDEYKIVKDTIRTYYKRTTFTADGTYTVPSGITKLKIDCVGAKGYTAVSGSYIGNGGNGGRVECDLAVSAGQVLNITVGTVPTTTSQSYNASDIRLGGNTLNDRIIVAGGGGSGVYKQDPRGVTPGVADGGAGGGLVGGNGGNAGADRTGQGGTQSAGGLGAYSSYPYHPFTAGNGEFGLGGTGNQNQGGIAGAGGAGWYGGGGAGCNGIFISAGYSSTGAAGGGGSSYTNSSCTNVVHTQGYQNGTGYITIDYESTSSDYDYYVDVNTYKALKV